MKRAYKKVRLAVKNEATIVQKAFKLYRNNRKDITMTGGQIAPTQRKVFRV